MAVLAAVVAPAASGATRAVPAEGAGEPRVERHVEEDARVHIEEVRVRGETQRLVVRPKLPGAPAYEIRPGAGSRDPSQGRAGGAGERVWRLLSF